MMLNNCSQSAIANSSYMPAKRTIYSKPYTSGLTFFYISIIVTCLVAYGLIILTVYFNRRLRTICNFFIISLGVADVMIVTMVIPVNISLLLGTFHFYSAAHCQFLATVNLMSISTVSLNLCTVSMERYFAIAYPFKYEAFTTTKTTGAVIGGIWLYALIAALLPAMGWRSQSITVEGNICRADNLESYTLFMTIGSFFIPAIIMVVSNFIVYRIATNQAKRVFRIVPVVGPPADLLRKNFRAAKRISLIVGAYLICWVPHMVVLVIGLKIGPRNVPLVVYPITLSMQYSCSAVNPCLFCFTNRELRKTLKKLIKAALGRKPERVYSAASDNGMAMTRRRSTLGGISQATEISNSSRGKDYLREEGTSDRGTEGLRDRKSVV